MRAVLCCLFLLLGSSSALAADSNRIIALEQDVRNLERLVASLEREVRGLRQQRSSGLPSVNEPNDHQGPSSDAWVDAAKWKRIRLGASELEVIEVLGRPTSMRLEGDARILLYAMEIGATGFLSGSVTLRDREVAAVEMPVLK
jgi:hypothetical protein